MRLYHFTDEKYGLEDLRENHLKVARISDLNDPSEFLAADLSDEELGRAMESMKASISEDYGILCFCDNWKSLVQWAHYGDRHKGLCLGFDIPDSFVAKVNYSESRMCADEILSQSKTSREALEKAMDEFIGREESRDEPESRKRKFLEDEYPRLLRQQTESDQNGQDFMKKVLTTKGVDWNYEREYRVFVPLQSCEKIDGLYFKTFSSDDLMLQEVITGPRCNVTCDQIEGALGKLADCVTVRKARISRSDYAVVEAIDIPSDKIAAFCQRWQIKRFALFGSVLRDDFGPDSDIDVLVKFDETTRPTLFDMSRMEADLKLILGRGVDLVSEAGIERSPNHIRRTAILDSAELVYGS